MNRAMPELLCAGSERDALLLLAEFVAHMHDANVRFTDLEVPESGLMFPYLEDRRSRR